MTESFGSIRKLTEFIKTILCNKSRTTKLINKLENYVHYQDILFFTWKILFKTLGRTNESSETYMMNLLDLLEKISINKVVGKVKGVTNEIELFGLSKGHKNFTLNKDALKTIVRRVWNLLLKRDMSPTVQKKFLFVLLESHLSTIENPVFFTDFFMSSLNTKGVIGILALQGVATLMQKHNIEYPNIYEKLYSFFEPSVFHTKYKSRLFYLANIFLSSTHLPENLVASFIKRASRLSLVCASPDAVVIVRFVENLLMRHTGLVKMIHSPGVVEVSEDPFLENEKDPMKTQASESSLWEISLLSSHCLPTISSVSNFINCKLPSMEFDLSEVLDNSYDKMFDSECKKTKKMKPSLTFEKPMESVAKLKDDQLFKMWSLIK